MSSFIAQKIGSRSIFRFQAKRLWPRPPRDIWNSQLRRASQDLVTQCPRLLILHIHALILTKNVRTQPACSAHAKFVFAFQARALTSSHSLCPTSQMFSAGSSPHSLFNPSAHYVHKDLMQNSKHEESFAACGSGDIIPHLSRVDCLMSVVCLEKQSANIRSKPGQLLTSVPSPRSCHVRVSTLAYPPWPWPESTPQAPNQQLPLRRVLPPVRSCMEARPCDYCHRLRDADGDTDSDRLLHHHRNDDDIAFDRDKHAEQCRRNRDGKSKPSWRRRDHNTACEQYHKRAQRILQFNTKLLLAF